MVERTFMDGLEIPTNEDGAQAMEGVVQNNAKEQVSWVQSFVSSDKTRTFCVYDGPTPEAIRRAANLSSLPVDAITEIRVLDPYFYFGNGS
jgi:hypothetical protein